MESWFAGGQGGPIVSCQSESCVNNSSGYLRQQMHTIRIIFDIPNNVGYSITRMSQTQAAVIIEFLRLECAL